MSLFGAMVSGISALSAQSQQLGIISDNISNVNTVGYKSSDSRFSSLVTSQASSTSYSPGGVRSNPVTYVDRQGLLQVSESPTDIALNGDGMLVVSSSTTGATREFLYTRAGSFTTDKNGNLINTAGYYLQGWRTDNNGIPLTSNLSVLNGLETLNVNGLAGNATATSKIDLQGNLPATAVNGDTHQITVQMYDALGVAHNITYSFTKTNYDNTWTMAASNPTLANDATQTTGTTTFTATGDNQELSAAVVNPAAVLNTANSFNATTSGSFELNGTTITYNVATDTLNSLASKITAANIPGVTVTVTGANKLQIDSTLEPITVANDTGDLVAAMGLASSSTTTFTPVVRFTSTGALNHVSAATVNIASWTTGAANSSITLNFGSSNATDGLTQFSDKFIIKGTKQNGVPFGFFQGIAIAEDGIVTARFDNGQQQKIFKIPVATFPNANGLGARNGNAFVESDRSGSFILQSAGAGGAAKIAPSSLEGSTVDLAAEFTAMIVTQRAYAASSRVISTADNMLEELIRIGR
ncbi:MAG: flagellar hook-basal body complex protein [Alphaproteobacteria bacterium]